MVEPLRIARDRYEDMKEKNSMPPVCFLYNLPVKQLTLRSVNMRQGNAVVHLENSVIYTGDRKYIFIHMKKHFIRVSVYYFFYTCIVFTDRCFDNNNVYVCITAPCSLNVKRNFHSILKSFEINLLEKKNQFALTSVILCI